VTSGHFIYIPMMLLLGIVIGFVLGGRAARDAMALQQKNEEKRAVARAEREARRAAARGAEGPPSSSQQKDA
jgi:hypothetical protein